MNASLQRKFWQIASSISNLQENNLRFYYHLGQHLCEIKARPDVYGENAFALVCKALATNVTMLRVAARFASEYTAEELDALVALKHPDTDFRLQMKHVFYLLIVRSKEEREAYARQAVEEMWDPAYLHSVIKQRYGVARPGGRRHTLPRTVSAQIRQIVSVSHTWLRKYETVWDGEETNVFANIMHHPPDQFTAEDMEQIQQAVMLFREIADRAAEGAEKCLAAARHIEHCVAAKALPATDATQTGTAGATAPTDTGEATGGQPRPRRSRRVVQLDSASIARQAVARATTDGADVGEAS